MARRVAGRRFHHDRSVSEDIVIVCGDRHRPAGLQRAEVGGFRAWRGRLGEHELALGLPDEPRRAGEHIGVPDMVPMKMREREMRDVARRVADLGQLRPERLGRGPGAKRRGRDAGRERAVGNRAHVPHQISPGMRDEKTRNRHHVGRDLFPLELVDRDVGDVQLAAIEHVEAYRLRRLRPSRLRHSGGRQGKDRSDHQHHCAKSSGLHDRSSRLQTARL